MTTKIVQESFLVSLPPEDQCRFLRRKKNVQQTWRAVEFGLDVEAMRIFYKTLFERYPSLKPMFSKTDMEKQAKKLFDVVRVVVRLLDDFDTLVPVLKDLGVKHARMYGVKREHYDAVIECFMSVLTGYVCSQWPTDMAGSLWSVDVADAWAWALTFIGNTMADAADEDADEADAQAYWDNHGSREGL
jgi:hemoglobin-like flavoprotein